VYRRLRDPAFRVKVDTAREELVTRTVGRLSALGQEAADGLHALLSSESDSVKLGACRAVLEYQFRGCELFTLTRAVADLRARLEMVERDDVDQTDSGTQRPSGPART
jgi:hypothetical protein